MKGNHLKILLSPFFLLGLFLLLINDFYLKEEFHNFFTGKLSDFAGLLIFPMFWSAFFPKRKLEIYISTAIFFIFWKSPFSDFLIEFVNSLNLLRIGRIVDFMDLWALAVLPFSYFYTETQKIKKSEINLNSVTLKKIFISFVCLFSLFAFTATSYEQDRDVSFDNRYELDFNVNELEKIVKNENSFEIISFEKQTDAYPANKYPDLKTDPTKYTIYFDLQKTYCESKRIRVFISFNTVNDKVIISYQSFSYWCEKPPTEIDRANLKQIFEQEVIEKIRQHITK